MENIINPRNNNRLIQKTSNDSKKPELTIKSLGEMLIEYIDRSQEEIIESRLFKPKRQLINYLFNGIGRLTEVQLKDQLSSSPLDKEDNLTLYTFYLSQTEHFNFEWSYLLSKLKNTHDFLKRFNKYINFVCSDINIMIASIQFSDQTIFQIDEFLQIIYSPIQNSISAQCKLDFLKDIISCKAGQYRLKIICGSKTIISLDRSTKDEVKSVADKIQTLLTIIQENNNTIDGKHEEN